MTAFRTILFSWLARQLAPYLKALIDAEIRAELAKADARPQRRYMGEK